MNPHESINPSLPVFFSFGAVNLDAASRDILACNDDTAEYGLTLSAEEARELAVTRAKAITDNDRVEFGKSAVVSLIEEFADSPYLDRDNYAGNLNALTEAFYYFKAEMPDMPDAELLSFMKTAFDVVCGGDAELLAGRELPRLSYNWRNGLPADYDSEPELYANNADSGDDDDYDVENEFYNEEYDTDAEPPYRNNSGD